MLLSIISLKMVLLLKTILDGFTILFENTANN